MVWSCSEELSCSHEEQPKKKSIHGIYHFHMDKLYCEDVLEEKNGMIFLHTQMEIHWESD